MLEKRVLELEGVLEVTRNANSLLKQEVDNTNAALALLSTTLPQ